MSCGPSPQMEAACAAALAALPGMGPATLVRILSELDPVQAWESVRAGRVERPGAARQPSLPLSQVSQARPSRPWSALALSVDPAGFWARVASKGVMVTWWGDGAYPAALRGDPDPPGVLFWRGNLEVLEGPRVAIVGTRAATADGRSVAFEMGRDLTAAGVCVLSGLALGIDGAAHRGSLLAMREGAGTGPVGVAASGVDVAYPRRHGDLWEEVARVGAIVSENLPGRPAQAWRFPARNRIIAGLAQMVVVVESHASGGSLITAEAAIERGIDVRVVPGPVRSPASAGTNQLLYDGPAPVRDARDVLDGLGIFVSGPPAMRAADRRRCADRGGRAGVGNGRAPGADGAGRAAGRSDDAVATSGPAPGAEGAAVLDAIGWRAVTIGQLVERTGRDPATVSRVLDDLVAKGLVGAEGGWWARRSGAGRT